MKAQLTTVSAVAFAVAFAAQAHAQVAPRTTAEQPEEGLLQAPTRALEVIVGSGYTQGFGELQKGVNMKDVATPGIGVDFGVGYRIDPHWQVGVVGQYQEFAAQRAPAARGMTAGANIAYHAMPFGRVDPWVQFGAGYRGLWETNSAGPDLLTQGLELGKLTLGLDLRSSRDIAIAPVIGADITLPIWQGTAGAAASTITDPRPVAYVFAGVQARFDVTAAHEPQPAAPQPVVVTEAVVPRQAPPPPAPPPKETVSMSDEVKEACLGYLGNPETAPKFEFDKSLIQQGDVELLQKVSECFATGPLQNDRVLLIGRADPRGPTPYNDALGMRRAKAVASFFEKNGVDEKRIETTSRGERDAVGTDEAGWAKDRRVDLLRIEIDHGLKQPQEAPKQP